MQTKLLKKIALTQITFSKKKDDLNSNLITNFKKIGFQT